MLILAPVQLFWKTFSYVNRVIWSFFSLRKTPIYGSNHWWFGKKIRANFRMPFKMAFQHAFYKQTSVSNPLCFICRLPSILNSWTNFVIPKSNTGDLFSLSEREFWIRWKSTTHPNWRALVFASCTKVQVYWIYQNHYEVFNHRTVWPGRDLQR